MTATQILAVGLIHLCTPGPQTGWPHAVQLELDQRDQAATDERVAVYGVTRDLATGLRRGNFRYRDGNPPTPFGCRWCGTQQRHHGRSYITHAGWHTWVRPTNAQILARMTARRAARSTR